LNSFSWPRRGGGQEVRNNLPSSTAIMDFRPGSGKYPASQPVLLLLCRVEKCDTRSYANQSESGDARVAGSNTGHGGNAPFFMRWSREVVHGCTVYGPKDGILSMTAWSSIQAITLASPPHFGQSETSMLNTLFRRCAQVMARWRCSGVLSTSSALGPPFPRLPGVTSARCLLSGANTP